MMCCCTDRNGQKRPLPDQQTGTCLKCGHDVPHRFLKG